MKINYRRLAVLLKWFPESFYTISLSDYDIKLQGQFKPFTMKLIRMHRFTQGPPNENGYLSYVRGNIEITLTD